MSIYSPIRDAFSDLNHLMADKQRWDQEHALRMEDQAMRKLQMESQMEDQKLRRFQLQRDAKEAQYAMEPVKVNLYDLLPNNASTQGWLDEDEFRSNLARVYGGADVDRASGDILDTEGQPVILPRMDKERRAVGATGLIEGKMDPYVMVEANQGRIKTNMVEVERELKQLKGERFISQRAPLEEQLSKLRITYEQHEKMKRPDQMIAMLRNKASYQTTLLSNAAANGADPQLLNILNANAARTQQQITTLEKESGDEKRWRAEMELRREGLNLEREKSKRDKDEKTQNYFAVRTSTDAQGNRVIADMRDPQNVKVGGVDKQKMGKSPAEAWGEEYKDFIWVNEFTQGMMRGGKETPIWKGVHDRIRKEFVEEDLEGRIMNYKTPDANSRIRMADKVLERTLTAKPEWGEAQHYNFAIDEANNQLDVYWGKRGEAEKKARDAKLSKDGVAKILQAFDTKFYDEWGFVPEKTNNEVKK